MSKKQKNKLLSTLNTGKEFHSSFGASILSKYGWKEYVSRLLRVFRGQGLGKSEDGIVKPVSVKKVEGNTGVSFHSTHCSQLGASSRPENEWHNWWDDMYNSLAAKVNVKDNSKKVLPRHLTHLQVKKSVKKSKKKKDSASP
ncbi:uncharacterized protein TOT_010000754 [Theileria orientalis strain Shintoku]|uniref:G-patch domain-containing protein n=1 Tax=Theileria orientalis strain Shintoku TaxID=869250 RepID=J4D619_THEOR|nr:uncharacterized protein TOT_010000754 [Theileria orientalis strain Shintoku]PVC51959.1 hypothetical protein MACL_00001110 [Theileria orientalis]BAM39295.1 uncharacterized protein TOT_010000754 [Theileria orientalis strain Shintoku]|eukprot:XP_009689596.1 uncharacterized protein TOT_010000754 [Theileria orientalis strain Shintoku]